MEPLEPPALHQVNAAYGWLELGNVPEALAELQRLPADCRALPRVRVARLDCLMAAKDWDAAACGPFFCGWIFGWMKRTK